MPGEELSGSYLEAIQRGFQFARELGHGCRPVHFLVGIAEGRGPAVWLDNRRVNLRDRWFKLRTLRHYHGAPHP